MKITKILYGTLAAFLLSVSLVQAQALSTLPAATAPTGAEIIPLVQGGVTSRSTASLLGKFAAGQTTVTLDRYTTTDLCATTTGLVDVIGSTALTLIIDRAVTCTATKTIPQTLTLQFIPGGLLTISTTKVLTINGPLVAPMNQKIFVESGTATVKLGIGVVREIYPQWWDDQCGVDYTHVCTTALTSAFRVNKDVYRTSFPGGYAACIYFSPGIYKFVGPITTYPGTCVRGGGTRSTSLYTVSTNTMFTIYGSDAPVGIFTFGQRWENIGLQKQNAGTTGDYYFDIDSAFDINFSNVDMYGTLGNGVKINASNTINFEAGSQINGISSPVSGAGANVGKAFTITDSNVFGQNLIVQGWKDLGTITGASSRPATVTIHGLYLESIWETLFIFDTTWGSTLTGLSGKVSDPLPYNQTFSGFSFINGSHHNLIQGGVLSPLTYHGIYPPCKSDSTSYRNTVSNITITDAYGTASEPGCSVDNSLPTQAMTNSALAAGKFDLYKGNWFHVQATNNTGFTLPAPTNMSAAGTQLWLTIRNDTVGTLGTITTDASLHTCGGSTIESRKPAAGKNRTFGPFFYDGVGVWWEACSSADVVN